MSDYADRIADAVLLPLRRVGSMLAAELDATNARIAEHDERLKRISDGLDALSEQVDQFEGRLIEKGVL